MSTYRITSPKGNSGLTEMNEAAYRLFLATNVAKGGWTIEYVGGSRVTIVNA